MIANVWVASMMQAKDSLAAAIILLKKIELVLFRDFQGTIAPMRSCQTRRLCLMVKRL